MRSLILTAAAAVLMLASCERAEPNAPPPAEEKAAAPDDAARSAAELETMRLLPELIEIGERFLARQTEWLDAGNLDPAIWADQRDAWAEWDRAFKGVNDRLFEMAKPDTPAMRSLRLADEYYSEVLRVREFSEERLAAARSLRAAESKAAAARSKLRAFEAQERALASSAPAPVATIQPEPEAPAADPLKPVRPEAARLIRQKAEVDWPGDERMQRRRIEREAEAWMTMDRYQRQMVRRIPYREKAAMVAAAQRKWPHEFGMQVREFEKQAAAWELLERWEREGIPGVPFRERKTLIGSARERWGEDHRMVVSEVERNARSPR